MAIEYVSRLPSNQQTYDLFWSGDPAFVQGEGKDHERKLEIARETGEWSSLLIQGQTPTKFVSRQVPGEIRRRLLDHYGAGKLGAQELDSLLVRIAVIDVVGFGDFKLKFTMHDDWGKVTTNDLPNALDLYAPGAVADLAVQVFNRMMAPSGK